MFSYCRDRSCCCCSCCCWTQYPRFMPPCFKDPRFMPLCSKLQSIPGVCLCLCSNHCSLFIHSSPYAYVQASHMHHSQSSSYLGFFFFNFVNFHLVFFFFLFSSFLQLYTMLLNCPTYIWDFIKICIFIDH